MSQRKAAPTRQEKQPRGPAFREEKQFLDHVAAFVPKTWSTYCSGLRSFARWLQHNHTGEYSPDAVWPLDPACLTMQSVVGFSHWLSNHRSKSTRTTYMAAVMEYLIYLEGIERLPMGISLSMLQRQLKRGNGGRNQAEQVVDLDAARQDMPWIVNYIDLLPLPPTNDGYNRRLTLLRNRAVVNVLYSSAARISEVVSLDRKTVGHGRSATAVIKGKGGKLRTIYIQDYAQASIRAYLAERQDNNPALFISHSRNSTNARLTITTVHNIVKGAVRKLGLEDSLSSHDFRHYRATQLLRAGMRLEAVQEFLGHADITTTRQVYAPLLGVPVMTELLATVDESPAEAVRRMKMCKPGGI